MITKKISGLILAVLLTTGSLTANGITIRDWANIFLSYNLFPVYATLLGDVRQSGRSEVDVFCEYFRHQNKPVYRDLMNNPNHVEAARACCAYEPSPSQYPVCSI